MSRRTVGVSLLLVGLLLAVVLPALLRAPVAGTARRGPVAPPPAVGDCVTTPVVAARSPLVPAGVRVGLARYAACPPAGAPGREYGEVVLVTGLVAAAVDPAGESAGREVRCRQALRDYLGWTSSPWDPVFTDALTWVGPDADQYANAQRWIACVLTSGSHGYPGTVRDAAFGRAADLFERCEDTRRETRARVQCYDPHDVEVFGAALVGPGDQPMLDDSCVRLIATRTRMADPTAGGQLTIRAGAYDPNTVPPDVAANRQAVTCGVRVADGRLLVASLVGIGDRPLPWS